MKYKRLYLWWVVVIKREKANDVVDHVNTEVGDDPFEDVLLGRVKASFALKLFRHYLKHARIFKT